IKLDRVLLDSMLARAKGPEQTAYFLRYGNYTREETRMQRKLKVSGLLLSLLLCYLGSLLSIYMTDAFKRRLREKARNKKEVLTVPQVLEKVKVTLEEFEASNLSK